MKYEIRDMRYKIQDIPRLSDKLIIDNDCIAFSDDYLCDHHIF